MKKIIVIDDKAPQQDALKNALTPFLSERYTIDVWTSELLHKKWTERYVTDESASNADEDVWFRVLQDESNIAVVVADHDLSAFNTVRISESAITDACKRASIPVCTYHRKPTLVTDAQYLKKIVSQTRSFSIAIDISNTEQAAREIISVANGFASLIDSYTAVAQDCRNKGPAAILAHILEKPGLTNYFSRYATGPTLASDLIDYISPSVDATENKTAIERRVPFILGCWLYNYILPFPGILPNEVASASYVNLSTDDFSNHKDKFINAKYNGPFGDVKNYWWRSELDRVLIDSDCEDGVAYLGKQGITATPSVCVVKNESPAGYYCLIKKSAISLNASKGRLSWIPEGADLCRIDVDTYDSIAPIMGL